MTQSTEQERAEFEAWYTGRYGARDFTQALECAIRADAYEVWLASRRAQVVAVQNDVAALVVAAQALVLDHTSHVKKLQLEAHAWGPLAAAPQPPESAPVQMPEADFYGFRNDEECRVDMCFSPASPRFDGVFAMGYYSWPKVRQLLAAHGVK